MHNLAPKTLEKLESLRQEALLGGGGKRIDDQHRKSKQVNQPPHKHGNIPL